MTLIKTNNKANSFNGLLENFFNEGVDYKPRFENNKVSPAVNISESADAFELALEAPGFEKENFKLELKEHKLYISAEKHEEKEKTVKHFTRKEFSSNNFTRSFILGENLIDGENISAEYLNGILHVSLPKKEEAKPQPATFIEIK